MDSKDTYFVFSWLQGKERHKALNANVLNLLWIFFFFFLNYASN